MTSINGWLARVVALACLAEGSACTSVQWIDQAGNPRSLGLTSVESVSGFDGVTRIVAPGAALRLMPGMGGYSLGWRETVVFRSPNPKDVGQPVAFADRVYGVALDTSQLVIGTSHTFAVLEPENPAGAIQEIEYSESDPAVARIRIVEIR